MNTFEGGQKTFYGSDGIARSRIDYINVPLRIKDQCVKTMVLSKIGYNIQYAKCARRDDHIPVAATPPIKTLVFDDDTGIEGWDYNRLLRGVMEGTHRYEFFQNLNEKIDYCCEP